jgi:hypothetical protein
VKEMNADAPRQDFSFTERNELACVLNESLTEVVVGGFQELELVIRETIQARVDMLLDLYRLAEGLTDQKWMEETSRRLSQLTFQTTKNANY